MRFSLDTKFSRGFFLSEEAMRKIEDLIDSRLSSQPNHKRFVRVRRRDDVEIDYDDSGKLAVIEDNSNPYRVEELQFIATSDLSDFKLIFKAKEKTALIFKSEDRDSALLLIAELKEYLKSEVFIRRFAILEYFVRSKLFTPLIFLISLMPMLVLAAVNRPAKPANGASIEQKLDYLVQSSSYRVGAPADMPFYFLLGLMMIGMLLTSERVYPAYTFYFGRQKSSYDSVVQIRDKVIWGLVIALFVSLAAAWLYDLLPFLVR